MVSERRVEYSFGRQQEGAVVVTVRFAPDTQGPVVIRAPDADDADDDDREGGGGRLVTLCVLSMIFLAVAGSFARQTRRGMEAAFRTQTAQLDLRTHNLAGAQPGEADARAMAAYRAVGGQAGQIQDDMVWLATNKVTPAAISRLAWSREQITVAGPYPTSPFRVTDRPVRRIGLAQAPGVYGYTVSPLLTARVNGAAPPPAGR
jgi:hypothetical protein